MFRFKARIEGNSWLLARFATPKLDILDARYEFMNRSEVPKVIAPEIGHQTCIRIVLFQEYARSL
jgi:hypothetical protein